MRHKRVTVVVGGVVIETTHSFSLGYEEIKGKEKKKEERKEKKNETTNVCRTAPNSNHLSRELVVRTSALAPNRTFKIKRGERLDCRKKKK